jgi:hypothetical protein
MAAQQNTRERRSPKVLLRYPPRFASPQHSALDHPAPDEVAEIAPQALDAAKWQLTTDNGPLTNPWTWFKIR